jgi:hypothetical protein
MKQTNNHTNKCINIHHLHRYGTYKDDDDDDIIIMIMTLADRLTLEAI